MEDSKFNYNPKDPMAEIRSKRTAEAMLQMGEELNQEAQPDGVDPYLNLMNSQPKLDPLVEDTSPSESQKMRTVNPRATTRKEQVRSAVPLGPKYMDALQNVIKVADIRSIETQLPILKAKVEINPLKSEEEIALRTSSVSPETFLKKLDEIMFSHTKFENFQFNSFNEFLGNLFPPDKSMIIWGLLTSSYLVLPTLEKECDSCGELYLIDQGPADLLHEDSIPKMWDKPLPPSEYTEVQTILNGYLTFELGLPSERDRLIIARMLNPAQAKENVEKNGSMLSYADNLIFFTKAIVVGEGEDKIVLTDIIQDIYPFLKNLPPKISDAVKNEIDVSVFDEYMPNFYLNTQCTHCGAKEQVYVDPETAFFRKTISV